MALQEVTVISHHAHTHRDKHQGIEYVFEPNKKVMVPLAAAAHFFGIGLPANAPARQAAWKRHGFTNDEAGESYLKKFEVKVVDLVPAGSDVDDLKKEHAVKLDEMGKAIDDKLATLEEDHRAELERINNVHSDEVATLKTRIVELEAASSSNIHKGKK